MTRLLILCMQPSLQFLTLPFTGWSCTIRMRAGLHSQGPQILQLPYSIFFLEMMRNVILVFQIIHKKNVIFSVVILNDHDFTKKILKVILNREKKSLMCFCHCQEWWSSASYLTQILELLISESKWMHLCTCIMECIALFSFYRFINQSSPIWLNPTWSERCAE